MRYLKTDILVIGGGATGTGILRDLAMRGFKCVLVERRDLAYGTTGRYHGLLHSGGRYVVKDPAAARECIEENRILRRIMPQCIEDTGGFFVLALQDDPAYVQDFINGCKIAGIPSEEITIREMLKAEPNLNPSIQRCIRVPDASADSFLASDLNAESARQHGGIVLTYHELKQLLLNPGQGEAGRQVRGAVCHDLVKDEEVQIDASVVVNSSGAWAGKICQMAGIRLQMVPGKGTMVALNHRVVNTVINRCKLPSDGDILVPAHTVTVMGTTDIRVTDPDHYSIEPWEIRLMLDEGEKIIPTFKQHRILRAWAGVRPLIEDSPLGSNRDISRSYTLIDHATRDGVGGLITITSGKWTTYRKMAEATVDKVCEKFGTQLKCSTHLEELPSGNKTKNKYFYLGSHLEHVEKQDKYSQLICECELVSRDDVVGAILNSNAITIDDIRRDVRLGMGPCQAAFCAFRAAGLMHHLRHPSVMETNNSLLNFLQERWKGNSPILWGQQLRQLRFNELIYISNLNIPSLPGERTSHLAPENYQKPKPVIPDIPEEENQTIPDLKTSSYSHPADIVIIGAGIAGLEAGWRASLSGTKVHIITKGWGSIYWSTGCIDIIGYQPPEYSLRIESPITFLTEFIKANPDHPYALAGMDNLKEAVTTFLAMSDEQGYPFYGSLESNLLLPTSLGTLRLTCLAPKSMLAGNAGHRTPMLIVGFDQFLDFYPDLIADNLTQQGILAQPFSVELKSLNNLKIINSMVLARLFDKPEFRQEVIDYVKPRLGNTGRVGFPAVLGIKNSQEAIEQLESALNVPVFEIPGLPPSIPGIRLHNMLVSAIERNHGIVHNGMQVIAADIQDGTITTVWSEASARKVSHPAKEYILATGGILGGGITLTHSGYAQVAILRMPIDLPPGNTDRFQDQFLSHQGHPLFSKGLLVDKNFQPLDDQFHVAVNNLRVIGGMLANCDPIRERSLEGIALVTGYKAGELVAKPIEPNHQVSNIHD